MSKARDNSIARLNQAIETIKHLACVEEKRSSMARKKQMENAYSTLQIHAGHLGLDAPRLGTYYSPLTYLYNATQVREQLYTLLAQEEKKA